MNLIKYRTIINGLIPTDPWVAAVAEWDKNALYIATFNTQIP